MMSCCGVLTMPVEMPTRNAPRKEFTVTGRFVLVSLILFFLVVASVNAYMMTMAIRTFPGADVKNGYETSQNYNKEIAAARQQSERGWVSEAVALRMNDQMRLTIALKDAQKAAVTGLQMESWLRHPSDKKQDVQLQLNEVAPGVYEALKGGIHAGAWNLELIGTRNGAREYLSRSRITVN